MDVLLLNLVKWLAGLAIPAALAMFVPRRWLVTAIATWSLLPLAVLLVLLIAEILRSPSEPAAPGGRFIALVFYGGFIAATWFVVSAIGCGIGLVLRQRAESRAPVTARPAAPPSQNVPIPPAAAPPPLSQWRARHVGFERDGLILDGLEVWRSEWRRLGTARVELPTRLIPMSCIASGFTRPGRGRKPGNSPPPSCPMASGASTPEWARTSPGPALRRTARWVSRISFPARRTAIGCSRPVASGALPPETC